MPNVERKRQGSVTIEVGRYDSLPKVMKVIYLTFIVSGVGIFIFSNWGWNIGGWVFTSFQYYYLLYALFFTGVFIMLPARKKDANRLPWYDVLMAAIAFGTCIYWMAVAWDITQLAIWIPPERNYDFIIALVFCFLAVESGRRLGGIPYTIINVIAITYPLIAGYLPGMFKGVQFTLPEVVGTFAFSTDGILGMPGQVMGSILIGFLVFCGLLLGTGAGEFFLNLAVGIMGRFRGGPAKVAVVASGFFGSLSGNPIANVVSTGAVTIPAMKQLGYPAHYAGAIEAAASSGGSIMPPVMGTIAFLIAEFAGVPYSVVMVAAILPALLYYFGLLMQVDAYAGRVGLQGMPQQECPSIKETLRKGWPFLAVLAFLVFGLLYMRWGVKAPLYSAALMILLSFCSRETALTPRRLLAAMVTTGKIMTQTFAMILPLGFIIAGLNATGMLAAFMAQLHTYGGGNVYITLLIGMATCYVFGLVGMAMVAYIVLASTMAPVLATTGGLDIVGVHLFILYYALIGGLTPPVAILAFIGASVAGAHPMKTAWTAMRLAVVLYFLPFFFVMNDALLLKGPIWESISLFALCLVGITFLAAGLEGYLLVVGRIRWWVRPFLIVGGFLIAFPEWIPTIYGVVLTGIGIVIALLVSKVAKNPIIS
ncbi:MAG TPA: TRAP transporter fused permease subunit [Dehalococcoidia bacterium]|nr:TRAP transporter fused permease subunit [Dehalococcoidia bacterium]